MQVCGGVMHDRYGHKPRCRFWFQEEGTFLNGACAKTRHSIFASRQSHFNSTAHDPAKLLKLYGRWLHACDLVIRSSPHVFLSRPTGMRRHSLLR